MGNFLDNPDRRYSIYEIIEAAMSRYPVKLSDEYQQYLDSSNMTLQDFGFEEYYHDYSTTNILAMEYLAENVTGRAMQDLIEEVILTPLGLDNTAEPPRDAASGEVVPKPVVHTYAGPGCVSEFSSVGTNVSVGYRNDAFMDSIVSVGTGGSMYSTIVDLLEWAKSGVGDSLLSPESVSARHVFKQTGLYLQYGIGMHQKLGDPDWYGHGGDAFGSNSLAYKNDDTGAAFASAFNTCGYSGLHDDGFGIIIKDMQDSEISTTPTTPSEASSNSGQGINEPPTSVAGSEGGSDETENSGSGLSLPSFLIFSSLGLSYFA